MFPSINKVLSALAPLVLIVASQSTTVDYCELLGDVISICELETTSFTQLAASDQATCLCGTTLGTIPWGPATFDGFAAECAVQYATLDTTIAHDASLLASFCVSFPVGGGAGGASSAASSIVRSSSFSLTPASTTVHSTGIVSTGIATPQSSASGGLASSTLSSHTTPTTTSTPAQTTVISIVSILPSASSSSSSHNAAVKDMPEGLKYIVCNVIFEVLVLAAFM